MRGKERAMESAPPKTRIIPLTQSQDLKDWVRNFTEDWLKKKGSPLPPKTTAAARELTSHPPDLTLNDPTGANGFTAPQDFQPDFSDDEEPSVVVQETGWERRGPAPAPADCRGWIVVPLAEERVMDLMERLALSAGPERQAPREDRHGAGSRDVSRLSALLAFHKEMSNRLSRRLNEETERRRQAEAELNCLNTHMASLMENAEHFAIYRLEGTLTPPFYGKVVMASPSLGKLLGCSEVMNMESWFEAIHPSDLNRVIDAHHRATSTGKFNAIFRIYNRTLQQWRVVQAITQGTEAHQGGWRHWNGIILDVTERQSAVQALRESESTARALLDAVNEPIWFLAPDLTVLDANETAAMRFQRSREQIIGLKPEDFMPPINAAIRQERMRTAAKTARPIMWVDERNGSFFENHCRPILDDQGQVVKLAIFSKDITPYKKVEIQLQAQKQVLEKQARDLEATNTTLKVLLSNRGHEKTELEKKAWQTVDAMLRPLLEKLKGTHPSQDQKNYLEIIETTLNQMTSSSVHRISGTEFGLTPAELEVAGFILAGKSSKEIATLLNASPSSIGFHRNNIRKKLGLTGTKTNLRGFLQKLTRRGANPEGGRARFRGSQAGGLSK